MSDQLISDLAAEIGCSEKNIRYLAARMMLEIGMGKPMSRDQGRHVYNRSRKTLFEGLFDQENVY